MSVAAQVLGSINNFFEQAPARGEFEVQGGALKAVRGELPALAAAQFYVVRGSALNDGLHEQGVGDLADEGAFVGEVVPCAVPKDLRDLISEIADWQEANGSEAGPYQSEGFDGYSYSMATDPDTGASADWRSAFRSRLHQWRRI